MDRYSCYRELAAHEKEGLDYLILARKGISPLAVMAPHGGGTEPGTADIADAVAGPEHAFYAFKGIKHRRNADLHLTSSCFDEPTGIKIVEEACVAVTIHGCRGKEETVYLGGRHHDLKTRIGDALILAGFDVRESTRPGLRGQERNNICNRCRTGHGVQLEISHGLRVRMLDHLTDRSKRRKTDLFCRFVEVLRRVFHVSLDNLSRIKCNA